MNEIFFCDSEVPSMYVPSEEIDFMNNSADMVTISDSQYQFYEANDAWYRNHDLDKKKFDVAGKTFSEIPHEAFQKCAKLFQENDRNVIIFGEALKSFQIHQYKCLNGWAATYVETLPIPNNVGKIVGVRCHTRILPECFLARYKEINKYLPDGKIDRTMQLKNPDRLHDAEFDTVYLLMIGLKQKEIAALRKVSISTVNSILTNVRIKMGLDKVVEIKDYAITQGWYNNIPRMFRGNNVVISSNSLNIVQKTIKH